MDITDESIVPLYEKSQIINSQTKEVICSFKYPEIKKYYHFDVEFDSYVYDKTFKKKIYFINVWLDLYEIYNSGSKTINKIVLSIITHLQIRQIKNSSEYVLSHDLVDNFISYRVSNLMYMIKWSLFRLNSTYAFDLKKRTIVPYTKIKKIKFFRYGGIIETNNINKIVHQINSTIKENKLIIMPNNFTDIYNGQNQILTFDKFFAMSPMDLIYWIGQKIHTLIIHECHIQFLPQIKAFISKINCQTIFVINMLKLNHYCSIDQTIKKCSINNISSYSNLWMNFSLEQKRKYKTEIIRMILTKFNQFYVQILYKNIKFPTLNIKLTPAELQIKNLLFSYHTKWINNSSATKTKDNRVKNLLFKTTINLIMSIIPQNNPSEFFSKESKQITSANYIRYQSLPPPNLSEECPICYSPMETPCVLICRHVICLECIINTIAQSNNCPLCKEFINRRKICIIKDDFHSLILQYLMSLPPFTLIITDIDMVNDRLHNKNNLINVININSLSMSRMIKRVGEVKNIVFFIIDDSDDIIGRLIGYFSSMNGNKKIVKINLLTSI